MCTSSEKNRYACCSFIGILIIFLSIVVVCIMKNFSCKALFWISAGIILLGIILFSFTLFYCKDEKNCKISDESILIIENNETLEENRDKLKIVCFSENIQSLKGRQFLGCQNLEHVVLPRELEKIPEYAFACCEKLSNITIPESVKKIESYAFLGCGSLEYIEVKADEIGKYAFGECIELKSLIIKNADLKIEATAFKGCAKLEKLTIPFEFLNEKDVPTELCFVKELEIIDFQSIGTIKSGRIEKFERLNTLIIDISKDKAKEMFNDYGGTELTNCEIKLENDERIKLTQLLAEINADAAQ